MTIAALSPPKLLNAEEYRLLPDWDGKRELRRGAVVNMPPPGFRHGAVCGNIHYLLEAFVRQQRNGRTLTNDSGIITERNPDTVRGADVTYYSYARVPQDQNPVGYAGASPEIVFAVGTPSNTRPEITQKTGEYLRCGVNVVCVVDSEFRTVDVHYSDRPTERLDGDALLTLAELPGFSVAVSRFFE